MPLQCAGKGVGLVQWMREEVYLFIVILLCWFGVCSGMCGWEDVAVWECLSSFVLYVVVTCKYYFTVASSSFIFSGLIKILQGYMLAYVTVLPFVGITYLLKKCVDCISLLTNALQYPPVSYTYSADASF